MSNFREAAEAAHREGFTYFDQLGGRQLDVGFEIWLRVLDPTTFESRVIKGQIATADILVDFSVADLWAGARWAEAEIVVDFRRAASRLTLHSVNGESAHLLGS